MATTNDHGYILCFTSITRDVSNRSYIFHWSAESHSSVVPLMKARKMWLETRENRSLVALKSQRRLKTVRLSEIFWQLMFFWEDHSWGILIPASVWIYMRAASLCRQRNRHYVYEEARQRAVDITYLPHKAVAEVSRDKEPIGRGCVEFKWFESRLMSDSSEVRFKWFGLSSDLGFKRFGCQSTCVSNDLGCLLVWALSIDACFKWFWLSVDLRFKWCGSQLIWDSSDSVVNSSKIQMIWMSIDLRFKWVGCQLIWDSSDLDVNRFEIQMSWLSIGLRFKWFGCQMIWGSNDLVVNWCVIQRFCQTKLFCETSSEKKALKLKNEAFLRDFLQKWSFEAQKRNFCARLASKTKLWRSKAKHFCETSFKIETLKLKKRSFSARLPSKLQLWSSKTKHFCETSFKNEALKLKNDAFVRDFLQKWNFDDQKRSISARLSSKMTCRPDAWLQNSNTF